MEFLHVMKILTLFWTIWEYFTQIAIKLFLSFSWELLTINTTKIVLFFFKYL